MPGAHSTRQALTCMCPVHQHTHAHHSRCRQLMQLLPDQRHLPWPCVRLLHRSIHAQQQQLVEGRPVVDVIRGQLVVLTAVLVLLRPM